MTPSLQRLRAWRPDLAHRRLAPRHNPADGRVPVHVVAARLGHADPSITLRVNAHVIREQVAEAADIFARSIPPAGNACWKRVLETLLLAYPLARRPLPSGRRAVDLARSEGLEPQPSDP